MFTFAVCDDQREDAENLRRCISLFAQTQEIPVQTDCFFRQRCAAERIPAL